MNLLDNSSWPSAGIFPGYIPRTGFPNILSPWGTWLLSSDQLHHCQEMSATGTGSLSTHKIVASQRRGTLFQGPLREVLQVSLPGVLNSILNIPLAKGLGCHMTQLHWDPPLKMGELQPRDQNETRAGGGESGGGQGSWSTAMPCQLHSEPLPSTSNY
jgi:hypothetical protein